MIRVVSRRVSLGTVGGVIPGSRARQGKVSSRGVLTGHGGVMREGEANVGSCAVTPSTCLYCVASSSWFRAAPAVCRYYVRSDCCGY